jgi:hypothetical protein
VGSHARGTTILSCKSMLFSPYPPSPLAKMTTPPPPRPEHYAYNRETTESYTRNVGGGWPRLDHWAARSGAAGVQGGCRGYTISLGLLHRLAPERGGRWRSKQRADAVRCQLGSPLRWYGVLTHHLLTTTHQLLMLCRHCWQR